MTMPSLKKDIIWGLAISTELEQLQDNQIVLITAYGIIKGKTTVDENLDKPNSESVLNALVENITKNYREKNSIPDDVLLPGNDGCISLTDVEILHTNGTKTMVPYLVVFFDQIIGVTIGGTKSN